MEKRVLVVDDHPAMLGLIADALGRTGYTVITAENGRDGLTAAAEKKPDLVILDLSMPLMTGLQVLRALRSKLETELLPVIVLTGKETHADALDSWMGGADRFLTKPCSIAELIETIEDILAAPIHH